ncbi:class I SAM-dependent methyltransferase [Candidatus Dojkabacteria bacterium]|nr:class I SAM-dependent methyltransferase [Candidatus Dojkabacteria bacterium]
MPNGLALAINILLILILLAYIVSIVLNFFSPFYTTPSKILKDIVKHFKLKKNEKFADLGCGDGRVVFATHRMYRCTSIGYEVSPVLLMFIKLSKLLFAPFNKKVHFIEEDFFKVNLKEYDVIYCCLPTDVLSVLSKKFKKELKKGSRVYSYMNEIPDIKGNMIRVSDKKVYEYTF